MHKKSSFFSTFSRVVTSPRLANLFLEAFKKFTAKFPSGRESREKLSVANDETMKIKWKNSECGIYVINFSGKVFQ